MPVLTEDGSGRVEVILRTGGDVAALAALPSLQMDVEPLGMGYAIATLPAAQLEALYAAPGVEYLELPRLIAPGALTRAGLCLPVSDRAGGGTLTGEGVLIAVLDSGIDCAHPAFRDEAGRTRVAAMWDQTAAEGVPPAGFRTGAAYTRADIDAALAAGRVPMTDATGHGTAVAGVAAGSDWPGGGQETLAAAGVAPGASLLAVKLGRPGGDDARGFARTTELMRGVRYALDTARALEMPLVLNISYGTNEGAHDGTSLFETYLSAAERQGRTVLTVAAGNEGSAGHHARAVVGTGGAAEIPFFVGEQAASLYLDCWYNYADRLALSLTAPGGETRALRPGGVFALDGARVAVTFVGPNHYSAGREVFVSLAAEGGGRVPQGVWVLRAEGVEVVDGVLDVWLPTLEEVGAQTLFAVPDPAVTLTVPSTAAQALTVGGYDARLGGAAGFSGRGYTRAEASSAGGRVKPDLVAPAVGVPSALAGGGYGIFTGTSLAAPAAAGAAALLMQWGIVWGNDPFLYGERVKARLRRAARRDAGRVYPDPLWGYGALCVRLPEEED